ncbi:MAG TPA: multiheme c-type cytochrome [bacterium]|nr:multiheme c-type cytochrome [bacterium]HPN42693.1 multiheme c-type cytochrome [bacterium]
MKKPNQTTMILLAGALTLALLIAFGAFFTWWSLASPRKTCLSCHEMQTNYDNWADSYHRDINCKSCHGGALSNGWHSMLENGRRVVGHFSGNSRPELAMQEEQILRILPRCKGCHEAEYADWQAGGHSVTYADIYLDATHNHTEQPHNDCMRCHGMFFSGNIAEIVTPVNNQGPWRFVDAEKAEQPVIPCLACHHIHRPGQPAQAPDYAEPQMIASTRPARLVNVEFYVRSEKTHFAAADLPALKLWEGARPVQVSDDVRQRVCSQCHAPDAWHQAGTSDDRTPRGVHEGLSCLACHAPHKHETAQSCGNCHPALSNCGLDVKVMDTTFRDPASKNNIHFAKCADCHKDGRTSTRKAG